ncbi:MAG: ABC transporter permease [Anaerolineae bacterium]|nr:ABC transporter permease [Anaerolineae bacterium]
MANSKAAASNNTFWAILRRMPRTWVGAALAAVVVLSAIFAPQLSPADPLKQFREGLTDMGVPIGPNDQFPMGTDHLGRDMMSRLLYGAQVSLTVSFVANTVAAIFGTLVGLLAGYYSGKIDWVLMRVTDVMLAFPAILLALGFGAVLRPSIPTVLIILTLINWPALARLVRSQVLSVRERAFIESARCIGANDWYIMIRQILPQITAITVVWGTLNFANTVLIESSLSFLGVGVPLPLPSWGNMIAEGQSRYRIAPWMILVPTAAILITTLGFNLLGDAIRDALDPRTGQRTR